MFVFVSISSFIVAIVTARCVPNPCQNGGTCFSFPNHNEDFGCKCTTGWDGQFCTIPFRYLGCYKDTSARIMQVRLPFSSSNSPLECAARCHGYAYSGTQVGTECFCGDCLSAMKMPESDCNRACAGDSSKKCGADWKMSVYGNRVAGMSQYKRQSWFGINADEPNGTSALFENY